ncbi:hypothetical protein C8F01DRAFT_1089801 [Mycena amicta]|nr:hypothetical protein C8F01DRAFT_1089801 [Mycena amicta]
MPAPAANGKWETTFEFRSVDMGKRCTGPLQPEGWLRHSGWSRATWLGWGRSQVGEVPMRQCERFVSGIGPRFRANLEVVIALKICQSRDARGVRFRFAGDLRRAEMEAGGEGGKTKRHVRRSDLCSVASSNRTFCELARPFLFADLDFLPYNIDNSDPDGDTKLRLPPPHGVAEFTKRLEVLTSNHLAPMIHITYIGVVRRSDVRLMALDPEEPMVDRVDAHSLLHLLVSRLECFTGLG